MQLVLYDEKYMRICQKLQSIYKLIDEDCITEAFEEYKELIQTMEF